MSYVEITLKSGATVTADVTEWITEANRITGDIAGFRWDKPGPRRLVHVNVKEVAAVVWVESTDPLDPEETT